MENRKSAKDWRKTHTNAENKLQKIKNQISLRLQELSIAHPDVVISHKSNIEETPILSNELQNPDFFLHVNTATELKFIEMIEKHIADQHPHKQQDIPFNSEVKIVPTPPVGERVLVNGKTGKVFTRRPEQKDFIEYHDDGDGYQHPERKIENEVLEIRLYCTDKNCMTYIKGHEGYNGAFHAETGQYCDLRNQGFRCKKHQKLKKESDLFLVHKTSENSVRIANPETKDKRDV